MNAYEAVVVKIVEAMCKNVTVDYAAGIRAAMALLTETDHLEDPGTLSEATLRALGDTDTTRPIDQFATLALGLHRAAWTMAKILAIETGRDYSQVMPMLAAALHAQGDGTT